MTYTYILLIITDKPEEFAMTQIVVTSEDKLDCGKEYKED